MFAGTGFDQYKLEKEMDGFDLYALILKDLVRIFTDLVLDLLISF